MSSSKKTVTKKTEPNESSVFPSVDISRRSFLKMVALTGAVLVVGEMGKKVGDVISNKMSANNLSTSVKKNNSSLSKISKDLLYKEDSEGVTFFDKNGSALLVFEKES
jgi:hypothetical protein